MLLFRSHWACPFSNRLNALCSINIAAFVGSIPVSHSVAAITTASAIPDIASVAAAAQVDVGNTVITDRFDGFISDNVSEHASSSGCTVSGNGSQLSDENLQSDFAQGAVCANRILIGTKKCIW